MAQAADRFEALFRRYASDPRRVERMSAQDILDYLGEDLGTVRRAQRTARVLEVGALRTRGPVGLPGDVPFDVERGACRPQSVEHVQLLVRHAVETRVKLRTMGSRHSLVRAIDGDSPGDLRLLLDGDLRRVEFLESGEEGGVPFTRVRVGAGCYLGPNPSDRSQPEADTFSRQLEARGLALPITGGITHQSVGGFLQTGSAGGSLTHGMADALESLELVDGRGEVREFRAGSDGFDAAALSLGLFGVVTHATFKVGPSYFVEGTEENWEEKDSLLGPRPGGGYRFTDALRDDEYMRINWFPQKYVRRVMQWSGHRVAHGGPRAPYKNPLKDPLQSVLAAVVLKLASGALHVDPRSDLARRFVGLLLRQFLPLGVASRFRDAWHLTVPLDDGVDTDRLIQVAFTEIWLPVERSDEVISRLEALLGDPVAAGNFAVELYGGKHSPLWLSPSHAGDVIRVDPYWWAYNLGDPEPYFARFWERLLDVPGTRFHWGKHQPAPGQRYGETVFGLAYLRGVYPRLDDWLRSRQELDPRGVFVTDYWRRLFELP
ncbi:D-arabinono-1,4-lactone oxidase [Myxococcaceae bacterium GXIMD 01537]